MALFGRKKKTVDEAPVEAAPQLPEGPEVDQAGLRSVVAHRDYLLGLVEPLPPFGHGLLDAWGLALCEDIRSEVDLPPFDACQMDGYAVRASDVFGASQGEPLSLPVVETVSAGEAASRPLATGQAIRIATGAPLPEGADAVVPVEFTDHGTEQVKVYEAVTAGEYVRAKGSELVDGTQLLPRGEVLDARSIGLLAAAGIDSVLARPRPRVVVVSIGAELVEPGRPLLQAGQIHDANGFMIAAGAKAEGCQVWRVQVPSADPDVVREAINDQLIRADLIITTGGVSLEGQDVVKQVMPDLGLCDFAEVAMEPGRSQGFGLIGDDKVPMLMLPGNPVAAYVSFQVFVRPVIRTLMGVTPVDHEPVRCVAGSVMRSVKGKMQFGRGLVDDQAGRRTVRLLGHEQGNPLGDLAVCNALVLLPEEIDVVQAGDAVQCWILDHD